VIADMTVAMQPVEVAQMTEGTAVIQRLQPGVPIVLSGQYGCSQEVT